MAEYSTYKWITKSLKIIKLTGLVCYTVIDGRAVFKPFDIVLFLISISIAIFSCVYNLMKIDTQNSSIIEIGNRLSATIVVFIAIIAMLETILFKNYNFNFVYIMERMDTVVKF